VTREGLLNRLHVAVVVVCGWLVFSSPWVSMLRRIPSGAGFVDYAHVVAGFAGLLLAVAYAWACASDDGWRTYFPWACGRSRAIVDDLAGLLRARIPTAESGGLFAAIEGLLLVALLAVAITGAAWFVLQGSAEALAWRGHHVIAARVLVGLIVAHVLAVASHLLDL
jgi:hypothetical protein